MPKTEQITPPLPEIIGTASAMQDVYRLVRLAAPRMANVLLIGETGTGKEVIAKAVHKLSRRADGPFIRVNCAALNENLLESELFGHIKGAFTGAVENKTGRFEAAHGGTIFLDEINSTSPKLQVKLLRVLQEREFERVGESRTIRVDVRVIAATNASLEDLVEEGEFREDLYYRLNVIPVVLPPLRERRDDIPLLAAFFLRRYADQHKCPLPELLPAAIEGLKAQDWPGNVRELENTLERLVVLSDGQPIGPDLLRSGRPRYALRPAKGANGGAGGHDVRSLIRNLVRAGLQAPLPGGQKVHPFLVDGLERELIEEVMRQFGGTQIKAAERLGINRNTLHKKIEQYKIDDRAAAGRSAGPTVPADAVAEPAPPEPVPPGPGRYSPRTRPASCRVAGATRTGRYPTSALIAFPLRPVYAAGSPVLVPRPRKAAMRRRLLLSSFALALTFALSATAADWPQWRGPARDGVSKETGLLKEWPKDGPPVRWKRTDLGEGYSTPSVAAGRVYVQTTKGADEFVAALDEKSGADVWATKVGGVGKNKGPQYPGTRSTPTVDGDRVYGLSSDGTLACLGTDGKEKWSRSLPKDFGGEVGAWAYTESVLIDGDVLVCTPGGKTATLAALNKLTGAVVWQSAVPGGDVADYASVMAVDAGGAKQYVQFLRKGVVGVDAKTGANSCGGTPEDGRRGGQHA